MTHYFISTVRYDKAIENGINKTVNEQYLIDALSFTEAEARTIEELTPFMSGKFSIPQIVKPNISKLMLSDESDADRYYKVKVAFISLDDKSRIEKKTTSAMLVQAKDFNNAYDRFPDPMKGSITDYEITSIAETKILDYFPYENK